MQIVIPSSASGKSPPYQPPSRQLPYGNHPNSANHGSPGGSSGSGNSGGAGGGGVDPSQFAAAAAAFPGAYAGYGRHHPHPSQQTPPQHSPPGMPSHRGLAAPPSMASLTMEQQQYFHTLASGSFGASIREQQQQQHALGPLAATTHRRERSRSPLRDDR